MVKKETSTYPLRLPKSLKEAAAQIAREDGTSINQFVATAVAEKVSAKGFRHEAPISSPREAPKPTSRRPAACCDGTAASRRTPKTACHERIQAVTVARDPG